MSNFRSNAEEIRFYAKELLQDGAMHTREEIMQYVNIFRAKIVDVCEEALIIEITGDIEKIDAFLSLLKGYGIKKISRTGLTAMSRGFRS